MNLDRRQFARAASSSLALFAIPGWFAACARTRALAVEPPPDVPVARPLLVLHVADDAARRRRLGHWFGLFLIHGQPAELAPLATCDIVCATTKELETCGLDLGDVHAVLDVPGIAPVAALAGRSPAEDVFDWGFQFEGDGLDEQLRLNHAWMAARLTRVLGPGSVAFERGLARERAAGLGFAAREAPSIERAKSAPCHALAAASAMPSTREGWCRELTASAVERWFTEAPKGSSWATRGACGPHLDKPLRPQLGRMCGAGFTPPVARRFLHLFSAEELAGG